MLFRRSLSQRPQDPGKVLEYFGPVYIAENRVWFHWPDRFLDYIPASVLGIESWTGTVWLLVCPD